MAARAQFSPAPNDPLRSATPEVDDVEARRARAAIESRLFSGPKKQVKVGRYRVEGQIGAGGMGVVYRAHDPELARDVALKLLNTASVSDDEAGRARGRLVREARAMAKLAHPNVIHVYDVGAVEDGVFIAMELVDGDPLSKWIAKESPSWRDTLRCYLDAGEGLAAAHEAGIVHRDFKPENVMLGSDGRVRVGDFGLAGGPGSETGRFEPAPGDSGQATVDQGAVSSSLTRTGALLGTPKYMAPEQEVGAIATARSDQFGFCVALYEGLYGHPPFAGNTIATYRQAVAEEAVQVPERSDVPKWVFELLRRGLHRDPVDRHPSMRALLDALRTGLAALSEPRPRKRRAAWLLALGVGVGAVITSVVVQQDEPTPAAKVATQERPPVPTTQPVPTPEPIAAAAPALAPDLGAVPDVGSADALVPAAEPTEQASAPAEDPPPADAVVASKPARKRGEACFYLEDKRLFFHAQRRRTPLLKHRGTCYSCRKAGAHVVAGLSHPTETTCRTNHLCTVEPPDACAP